ncbi:hypothetical protein ALP93_101138, partial [Pseudomonas syringae pv. helianthi]
SAPTKPGYRGQAKGCFGPEGVGADLSAKDCKAAPKQATLVVSGAPRRLVLLPVPGSSRTSPLLQNLDIVDSEGLLRPGGRGSGLVREGLQSGPKTGHLDCIWCTEAPGFAAGSRQFADESAPTKPGYRGQRRAASARRAWERTCPRRAAKRPQNRPPWLYLVHRGAWFCCRFPAVRGRVRSYKTWISRTSEASSGSATRYGHALDQDRTGADVTAQFKIAANGDDLLEHVTHVAGNGHFLNRELNFAVFDPETRCAPRIVAGNHVQAATHQLGHQQATAHTPNQRGLIFRAMGDEKIVDPTRVGSARHTQLAAGISAQYVGNQITAFHERLGKCCQTVAVERRTAHRMLQVRTLIDGHPLREQLLTKRPLKKR